MIYFRFFILSLFLNTLKIVCFGIDGSQIIYEKVGKYKLQEGSKNLVVLFMDYADYQIKNPLDWFHIEKNKKILEIDIVFSDYPKKKKDWITNYDTLLNRRIREIEKLIPILKKKNKIEWRAIIQTDCSTEEEAKNMFHGVIIKFSHFITKETKRTLHKIKKIIDGKRNLRDSIFFKTLLRNPKWKNMMVITDWTSSMYSYGAEVILWHRLHYKNKKIKYLLFFNDGNHLADSLKEIGKTGGIYGVEARKITKLLMTIKEVVRNGTGGDIPENDIEAILFGIKEYGEFDELILIADNNSNIRDIELAEKIKIPIRILLCGLDKTNIVHPDYFTLALKTKGSLHTKKSDITNLSKIKEGGSIEIEGYRYELKNGVFILDR